MGRLLKDYLTLRAPMRYYLDVRSPHEQLESFTQTHTTKETKHMSFKIIAKPALNKDGYAKVTFKGHESVEAVVNVDTGEITKRAYVKLMFDVMDTTRKSPIRVNVVGSGALGGRFLTTLEALGFDLAEVTGQVLEEDSDGFAVETTRAKDSDGFEIEEPTEDVDELVINFLESVVGTSLLAKVTKDKRGYWEIDVDTLKPLSK
jgi:hypothetical protein